MLDSVVRDSPPLFLAFAASDGVLAAVTTVALLAADRGGKDVAAPV